MASHRSFMIQYARNWPVQFLVLSTLYFYGIFDLVARLFGGEASGSQRNMVLRLVGALFVALLILVANRRQGRASAQPAA